MNAGAGLRAPLSDHALAVLAAGIYGYPSAPAVAWDRFVAEAPGQPVCAGLKYEGDATVLVFRGTAALLDFMTDLDTLPATDPTLGPVHAGFLAGMRARCAQIAPLVRGPLDIAGHSLGAGHAQIAAGLFKAMGVKPRRVVCLGPPRAGYLQLADYLADIPIRLYRATNPAWPRKDPVCDVPPYIPDVLPYVHVAPLIAVRVTITPAARADMGLLSIHYSPGYAAAI